MQSPQVSFSVKMVKWVVMDIGCTVPVVWHWLAMHHASNWRHQSIEPVWIRLWRRTSALKMSDCNLGHLRNPLPVIYHRILNKLFCYFYILFNFFLINLWIQFIILKVQLTVIKVHSSFMQFNKNTFLNYQFHSC